MEESTQNTPQATAPEESSTPQTPSSDSTTMALLCHLLAIFTGFVGPLIIWLIKKDQDAFVAYHGKEALNFAITAFIACVGCIILSFIPFIGLLFFFLVLPLLCLAIPIFMIIATISTSKGSYYKYPVAIRLIK